MSNQTCDAEQVELSPEMVCCVTVTYGQRRALLLSVLDAVRGQGVGRAIVVDNGASWPVKDELIAKYGDLVDVVEMGANTGSARGFKAGISRAVEVGAEYIWLLDDDNRPEPCCLDALLTGYKRLRSGLSEDLLAVLASRPAAFAQGRGGGVSWKRLNPRLSAFMGFHIYDIPYKFWRRLPWGRARENAAPPEVVYLDTGTYGGLLFHRAVSEAVGLPREDFLLYEDDREYTSRITSAGGRIALVTAARVEDIILSHPARYGGETSFGIFARSDAPLRIFYGIRNAAYFGGCCKRCNRFMFLTNLYVYLAAISVTALLAGRTDRCRLVMRAAKDGLAGRLGPNPEFPL